MSNNFCFVIGRELAGMAHPGSSRFLRENLEFLKDEGIGAIVSLTLSPLEPALVEQSGFRYLHIPVEDFTPPTLDQVEAFIRFFESAQQDGLSVVVHCGAGQGRTGTMLACAFVERGFAADEAIRRIRDIRPCSIETADQEHLIERFEEVARKKLDGTQGPEDI